MDAHRLVRQHWPLLLGALAAVLLIAGLAGTCTEGPNVNDELARTARVAVESAEQARRASDAAYLWPARLRLIAIVVGVTVPIAAAVVLVYLATRHRPDDSELLTQLEQHGLIFPGRSPRQLPRSATPELTAGESELDQDRPADETTVASAPPPTDADKPD